jgi:hypothetical protein
VAATEGGCILNNETNQIIIDAKDKPSFADVELSASDETILVGRILSDFANDTTSRKDWEENKAQILNRYLNKSVRTPPFKGGADIVCNVLQQNVDAILPRCTNAFINTPYVTFTGVEDSDKEKARDTEKLYNYYLDKHVDYPTLIEEMNADTVLYGTAWLLDYLDKETKLPSIKCVPIEDVFVPYNTYCDVNELPHVIYRYYRPGYEVGIRGDAKTLSPIPDAKDISGKMVNLDAESDLPVEIVRWYGRLMVKEEMKDVVVEVAVKSRKVLSRFYLNEVVPYAENKRRLPLNPIFFQRIKGVFYGIGMGDILKGLHDWKNSTVNQIIDATNWSIIPFGAFRAGSRFNPAKFTVEHGMMIPLDDVNDLKFYNIPNNAAAAQNMLPEIQADIERSSAISDYNQGRESQNNEAPTWRGTAAILQESMIRIDSYIKRAANLMLPTLNNLYYWLQATLTEEDIVKIMGTTDEKVIGMLKDSMSLTYDLSIHINYNFWSRDAERMNSVQLATMFVNDPDVQANKALRLEMKSDIFKSMGKDRLAELLNEVNSESARQDKENSDMIRGNEATVSMDDDHKSHIKTIDILMNQELWGELQPHIRELIENHKAIHESMFQSLLNEVMAGQQMQAQEQAMANIPQSMPQMPQETTNIAGGMVPPVQTNTTGLMANPQQAATQAELTPPEMRNA